MMCRLGCELTDLAEVKSNAERFRVLINAAFSPGICDALLASAELARAAGVKEEELLTSVENGCVFM